MTINIANNNPRINYTATANQTVFTVPFEFFDNTDIKVYIEGTLKTITTHYTVSGGNGSTGTVTMSAGVTLNDEVTLVRDVPLERTTDLTSSYNAASIDAQLDRIVAEIADLDDRVSRTIQINDYELASGLLLPALDSRKGKTIQFNTSSGALEVGPTGADLTAIGSVTSEIATLAGISSNITTVAGSNAAITAVSNSMTSVNAINTALTNVNRVGNAIVIVDLVGTSISDVNDVADSLGEISAVQAKLTSIDTVAVASTNIGTVAGSITQVNNVASKIADVTGVNANISAITTANANSTNVNLVANNIDDVNDIGNVITKVTTVADNITSVNTVAPKVSEISTVSANIGNINTVATNISTINSAAGSAADALASKNAAATSATNAANSATASASSATAAAASASSITGAETNAANSATSAATSATAAQTAKTAAETALDEFTDIYLGSKSTAPTVDNDGNALATGSIYWNSGVDQLYIWTGSAWDDAAFTASGAVTSFNTRTGAVTLSSADVTNAAGLLTTGGTMTGDLSFGDSDKAIFGAGSDIEISSNGTSGIIRTGNSSSDIRLESDNRIVICDRAFNETFAVFNDDDDVKLYHNNAAKLATTSTGIDVTGTVTADGLLVEGEVAGQGASIEAHATVTEFGDALLIAKSDNASNNLHAGVKIQGSNNPFYIYQTNGANTNKLRFNYNAMSDAGGQMTIDNNGDISFYEDTGTTAKFHWDASAERLGVGTSSPNHNLSVNSSSTGIISVGDFTGDNVKTYIEADQTNNVAKINSRNNYPLAFSVNNTERMRIDTSGSVGIGVTPEAWASNFSATQNGTSFANGGTDDASFGFMSANAYRSSTGWKYINTNVSSLYAQSGSQHIWSTATSGTADTAISWSEAMRIDSSGNVLVGTTTSFVGGVTISPLGVVQAERNNVSGVFNRTSTDGEIVQFRKDGSAVGSIGTVSSGLLVGSTDSALYFHTDNNIYPYNPSSSSYRNGDVDLGWSSGRFKDLHLSGGVSLDGSSGNTLYKSGSDLVLNNRANAATIFGTNNTERMRIDSSGNVLVGATSTVGLGNGTNEGISISSSQKQIIVGTDSDVSLYLNRQTSDGDIAQFRKNGTTVGSIGTLSSVGPYFGNGDTAMIFRPSANSILPWDTTTNYYRDNAIDLGDAGDRFKDLYLSGGVYLGGTGSANKLDDYEYGSWTPTTPNGGSATPNNAVYTKIGDQVTVWCLLTDFTDRSTATSLTVKGLPFNSTNGGVAVGTCMCQYVSNTVHTIYMAGSSGLQFYKSQNGSGFVVLNHSDLQNSAAQIYLMATYTAA